MEEGTKVKVAYKGTFDDGFEFDSGEIEFEVGKKQVVKGFDDAVKGMKVGEEKDITIKPEEGYGEHKPEAVVKVPRDKMPDAKEGMGAMFKDPEGREFQGKVIKVEEKEVTVDFNHPLAGKTLHFHLKVLS